ncbi:MAG: Fe-S cluster assembly ATPase SufC [Patescibacteria group bacterium]
MSKLVIKNLHGGVNGQQILKGVNLEVDLAKVHVLMGPNGSGKTTLANVIMGNPKFNIDQGKIFLDGEDITELAPNERAKRGLFMSFQYPNEITGVTMNNFLRTAYNSIKDEKVNVVDFHNLLKEKMKELNIDPKFSRRYINEGFSGGEKKRAEILQMAVLKPKYAILDETDSGTDIDALKIIAQAVNNIRKSVNPGILLITHYNRILQYVKPDKISVMLNGKIVKEDDTGKLADEIEAQGYTEYVVI